MGEDPQSSDIFCFTHLSLSLSLSLSVCVCVWVCMCMCVCVFLSSVCFARLTHKLFFLFFIKKGIHRNLNFKRDSRTTTFFIHLTSTQSTEY